MFFTQSSPRGIRQTGWSMCSHWASEQDVRDWDSMISGHARAISALPRPLSPSSHSAANQVHVGLDTVVTTDESPEWSCSISRFEPNNTNDAIMSMSNMHMPHMPTAPPSSPAASSLSKACEVNPMELQVYQRHADEMDVLLENQWESVNTTLPLPSPSMDTEPKKQSLIPDYFPSAPGLSIPRVAATSVPIDSLTQSLSNISIRSKLGGHVHTKHQPQLAIQSSVSLPYTVTKAERPKSPKLGFSSNHVGTTVVETIPNSRITKRGVLVGRGGTGRARVGQRRRIVSGGSPRGAI